MGDKRYSLTFTYRDPSLSFHPHLHVLIIITIVNTIGATLASLPHRLRERVHARIHVALRRRDAGVTGEQLQLVHRKRKSMSAWTRSSVVNPIVPPQDRRSCLRRLRYDRYHRVAGHRSGNRRIPTSRRWRHAHLGSAPS